MTREVLIGRGRLKYLHELLIKRYHADPDPKGRARGDIDGLLEFAFRDLSTHYAEAKGAALKALVRLQGEALEFYEHVLHSREAPDVAHLEKILRGMDAEMSRLGRGVEDIAKDMPPVTRPEAFEPRTGRTTVEHGGPTDVVEAPGSAKPERASTDVAHKAAQKPARKPHEERAELLGKERDLAKDMVTATQQVEAFGREAGDLDADLQALRATRPSAGRDSEIKRLENRLKRAEEKEAGARKRVTEIEKEQAQVNDQLKDLAKRGVDPSAGYYRRTQPELVPLERLDHPPATWLESAGAGGVAGERMRDPFAKDSTSAGEQRVLAAIKDESAMRTHIEPGAAEDFDYKDALTRGEIGIQRPGRVNEGGADFITARRNPSGEIEIVLHDATINRNKTLDQPRGRWEQEAVDAIEVKADGSSRLRLHDEGLENEIRAALRQRRFVVETTLVEVLPNGVRFTPLN